LDDVHAVVTDLRDDFPNTEFSIEGEADEDVLATGSLPLVLAEIGENAAKHGDSSSVTYRVDPTSDGDIAVHVIDDGPGLPAMEQRMLETGRETPVNHGTGIGLWLVNWVITGLGGKVTASVDGGTTVTIQLPLATEGTVVPNRNSALSTYNE
jgi:signal transduction histidine kinase